MIVNKIPYRLDIGMVSGIFNKWPYYYPCSMLSYYTTVFRSDHIN